MVYDFSILLLKIARAQFSTIRNIGSIVFTYTIFGISISNACLWDSSEPAYWPSNNIGVCFVKPANARDVDANYLAAKATFTQSVREEFNARTSFTFNGFDYCDYTATPLPPMIRVNFTKGTMRGSSGADGLSGAGSARSAVNVEVDYLTMGPNSNKEDPSTFVPSQPQSIKSTGIHEILHMLGFQHDDSKEVPALLARRPNWLNLAPRDHASVTNWNTTSGVLSSGDLWCLEKLARREIARPAGVSNDRANNARH